jgi:hypothetical protein
MVWIYMPGLHFQGYSLALLLLQWTVLLRLLWGTGLRPWHWPTLLLLGFLQGWLSFDLFFVVSFCVIPLWLMRRAEGIRLPNRWIWIGVALPSLGFALAHFLHFLQVAAELGGLHSAFAEFRNTAVERASQMDAVLPPTLQALFGRDINHLGYPGSLAVSAYYYVREVLILRGMQFGPLMLLAVIAALPILIFNRTQVAVVTITKRQQFTCSLSWPGPKRILPAIVAALLVCLMWVLVMPAHVAGNFHITLRQFFFFYFCLVLTIVRSTQIARMDRNITPHGSHPVE